MVNRLEDLGEMRNFDLDSNDFGYRYFDMEEENSKKYLEQFKELSVWFYSFKPEERPHIIKQWREMEVQGNFENFYNDFLSKLWVDPFNDNETMEKTSAK